MSIPVVKFNVKDRPEFFKELRSRVNGYFKENKIDRYANAHMKIKTVFMLCSYFVPLGLMLTGVVSNVWGVMFLWFLMGLGMTGVGLGITHDANHGAYSKNQKVNKMLGFVLNFTGAYHINWKIQHNVLHHSFTNVTDFDEDINTGALRLSPGGKKKAIYRFQAFYALFLYGLMTIYWYIVKDFGQIVRYGDKDLYAAQGLTKKQATAFLILHKTWYFALTIALPLFLVELDWWQTLLGFVLMQATCGISLALIFQAAHVIEETEFFVAEKENGHSVENHWAIHQMKTTANFANNNRVLSWLVGGLNYQVEHHLFPNICHVHYRELSKIVKKTAAEYNIPYLEHKTFIGAIKSHFSMLNKLGKQVKAS